MYDYLNTEVTLEWGWELTGPLLFGVLLLVLGVPVWASLGVISILILHFSGVLPLALLGEALFDGIDAFALIAIPLFILTGDVLVRTGLSANYSTSQKRSLAELRPDLEPPLCWFVASLPVSRARMQPVPVRAS